MTPAPLPVKSLPVLLLAVSVVTAGPGIICPSSPVHVVLSQDVVLQCHLEPLLDANKVTVRWTHGPQEETVVLYRDGWHVPAEQKERFESRASLSNDRLTKGNLSLTLSKVNLTDSGRYQCSFSTEQTRRSCYVNLTVDSKVVGSHEPVKAEVGQDAILPCHLEPPFDVTDLTVEWKRNGTIVHLYRTHKDYLHGQDKAFKGRTSLFHDEMSSGNISLKLTNVTTKDSGNYTCFVPKLHSQVRKGNITLDVVEGGRRGDNTTAEPSPEKRTDSWIALGVLAAIIAIGVCTGGILYQKQRQIRPRAGQDNRGQQADAQVDHELDRLRDGDNQPDNNT